MECKLRGAYSGLTLTLLGLAFFLVPLASLPLIRAEAMYALMPKEMLASGQWLLPTLNGVPYLDKPPLLHWLTLLAYKLFGVSEGVARLPALLCALGEVWFTWRLGLALFDRRAAWLGGLALLTSVGFFAHHLQILTDHLISLSLTAALYFLWRWQEEPGWRWTFLFYLGLTLGFLSKGLIGLAFPLLIGASYALASRQPRLLRLFCQPLGWLGLVAVSLPWFFWAEAAQPGFFHHHFINEQFLRFLGQRHPPDIVPFPLSAFWVFLLIWLIPWTFLLPEALYRFCRNLNGQPHMILRPTRKPEKSARLMAHTGHAFISELGTRNSELSEQPDKCKKWFLLLWPSLVMGFFSLSGSRIEYYSLPALPPLALILGWRLEQSLAVSKDRSLASALLVLAGLALATHLLLPSLEQLCAGNRREFAGMFALIQPIAQRVTYLAPALALTGALLALWRPTLAVAAYGATAMVLIFYTYQTMSALSPLLSDKIPGDFVRQQADPQDLLIMENIEEFEYGASLAFYTGRRLLIVQRQGLPQFPYPALPAQNYLITPRQLEDLWSGSRRIFLLVDDAVPPAPPWQNAPAVLNLQRKRLLVNQPLTVSSKP